MLSRLELSPEMHIAIAARCREQGIEFLSTAFDPALLRYLVNDLKISRVKIPSGEITNPKLLGAAADSGLPILLSTGMCTLADVGDALGMLAYFGTRGGNAIGTRTDFVAALNECAGRKWLEQRVTILHCVSEYPTALEDANLRAISTLKVHFCLPVGYSDHTIGSLAPLGAVALGASVIEKHITLDTRRSGPDHKSSLPVAELPDLIKSLRELHASLGDGEKAPTLGEIETSQIVRRGVYSSRDLPKGHVLTADDICLLRPATKLDARDFWSIVGRTLPAAVRAGDAIDLEEPDDGNL
jgi:N-acetylneuraminate synthase